MSKKYRIGEFAERVGRATSTIRRWEAEGRIAPKRTATGQRYFDESDVRSALGLTSPGSRLTVVYCRVSSNRQQDELSAQISAMESFCLGAGMAVDEWITEVGGGMDFHRPKFLSLMDRIERGEISRLVLAHKDRLARFGFEYLEHAASRHDCHIIAANTESTSPRQELAEDLLAIMADFSRRLPTLVAHRKNLKDDLTDGAL